MAADSTAVDVSFVTCVSNISGVPAVAGLPSFIGKTAVASVLAVAELPYWHPCCWLTSSDFPVVSCAEVDPVVAVFS